MKDTPVKSSLSEARTKISYEFFKDIYENDLQRFSKTRKTYEGFYIYAVDGDDLELPASADVLEQGYRGHPYAKEFETYYPKMYTSYAYDVLNGVVQDFKYSSKYQEFSAAVDMVQSFEKNSIAIYDRLYCGYPLIERHISEGNHFIIRVKINDDRVHRPVRRFLDSGLNEMIVDWYPHQRQGEAGVRVRLVRVMNPKTQKVTVFATSLLREQFSRKKIHRLYLKRWEVETFLRDLTQTLKVNQWHSKKINGILQEIFVLFWFVNAVKMQMSNLVQQSDFLKKRYAKSNFKLCARLVIDNISLIIWGKSQELIKLLKFWISRTQEKRKHCSRQYPREVKRKLSKFPVHSKVLRRKSA